MPKVSAHTLKMHCKVAQRGRSDERMEKISKGKAGVSAYVLRV
jgi:hypothetical protein